MYSKEYDIPVDEYDYVMQEMSQHGVFVECCELIYKHGMTQFLLRLSDYCEDSKEAYALRVLSAYYKENESAFCKDAPTMQ